MFPEWEGDERGTDMTDDKSVNEPQSTGVAVKAALAVVIVSACLEGWGCTPPSARRMSACGA